MKSYSAGIKDELTKLRIRRTGDAKALLCAFTLSIGALKRVPGKKDWGVRCVSENEAAILFTAKLASKYYGLEYEIKQVEHERLRAVYNELLLYGSELKKFMLETGFISLGSDGNITYSSAVPIERLKTETQKKLFLRGLFLACGSVVSPEKAYHAELVLKNGGLARYVSSLLSEFGINAKSTKRKTAFIIYIKEADALSDFMALIGASDAVMDIADIRINKQAAGKANRDVNCICANINRISRTAEKQADDIRFITDRIGFESLPSPLRITAEARLNNMDMSLTDLAELLGIGKSAVNYRLKKLSAMADEMRLSDCAGEAADAAGTADASETLGTAKL